MAKNIIIGVGNLLFCDDGVGILALHYLKENYNFSSEIELLDGGTLGFGLIDYFLEYDNVFILDTISLDDEAGSIYKIPSDELLGQGGYKNTAHEVEVVSMLEAAALSEQRAEVTILAIVPSNITTVQIGVSSVLQERFSSFILNVIESLRSLGVEANFNNSMSLEEVTLRLKG